MPILPEPNNPTDVNDDDTILFPKVDSERTEILLILYSLVVSKLKFSEDVQFSEFQSIDLSVKPFKIIPPPAAVISEGESTLPISMFISSTVSVVELIVVCVPVTVKLPVIVALLFTVKDVKLPEEGVTLPI